MYNYILFDLDGTLTDPGTGITNSVTYALKKFGITVESRAELYKFIGPPLCDSFQKFYGFSEEQAWQAVSYYREYFQDKGIFENIVYDGIREVLEILKNRNKVLVLATSKPREFAVRILEHFDLLSYFDFISGATMDGSRSDKTDIIRYALEKNSIITLEQVIMVGDRKHDVIGAKKNHIASVGVLYGYGSREELTAAGVDYIISTPLELPKIL